jgi:hypothetical protein
VRIARQAHHEQAQYDGGVCDGRTEVFGKSGGAR